MSGFDSDNPDQTIPATPATPAAPAPASAQPQPAQPSQPTPQGGQPQAQPQGQGQPQQPQQKPVSRHAQLFDHILNTISPPRTYIDANGQQQTAPTSGRQIGNAVVASVLAGMFSGKSDLVQGAGGEMRHDAAAGLSNGFQAGEAKRQQFRNQPQQMSDDMTARRLATTSNNIKLMQQASAMALQQHQVLDDVVQRNQSTILSDAKEWDSQQDGNDPSQKAILAQGLTVEQAMNQLKGKMTSQNAFIDGTVDVRNPQTGVIEAHPTYSILNPDVKIKLSEKTTKELAKYNKQYDNAFEVTGGNVSVPLRAAIAATHQANTLSNAESFFNRAATAISGGEETNIDLAKLVKNDSTLMPAINEAEKAMAAGGNTANVMAAVRQSPQGAKLMSLLGITPEETDQYIRDSQNQATSEESEAKSGGKIAIEKAKAAKADAVTEETAKNILANPNSMASIYKITSLRSDAREKLFNKLEDLSGGQFNVEEATAKAKTYESFTNEDGKARQQIQSYGTFLKHDGNLVDVLKQFIRPDYTPKWIDKPLNWLESNVASDPEIAEFMARVEPVKSEFLTFMKNNKAPLEQDVDDMNKVVDMSQSPRSILRTAQTLAETGVDRLDSLNSTYKQNFGNNAPNLFDNRAQEAAVKLGLGDRLREYGINPPQSQTSQNQNQPQSNSPDKIAAHKQQVLQSIKQPNGQPYKDVKFGPNNTMVVWDGIAGHPWVDPTAQK